VAKGYWGVKTRTSRFLFTQGHKKENGKTTPEVKGLLSKTKQHENKKKSEIRWGEEKKKEQKLKGEK